MPHAESPPLWGLSMGKNPLVVVESQEGSAYVVVSNERAVASSSHAMLAKLTVTGGGKVVEGFETHSLPLKEHGGKKEGHCAALPRLRHKCAQR